MPADILVLDGGAPDFESGQGASWPRIRRSSSGPGRKLSTGSIDQTLTRRKLLAPLTTALGPIQQPPRVDLSPGTDDVEQIAARWFPSPSWFPAPPSPCVLERPPPSRHRFNPPDRPHTAGRPNTADRPRIALLAGAPLGPISFPSRLRLRAHGEQSGTVNPWSNLGEALVLPVEAQRQIRELVAASDQQQRVTGGSGVTAWAIGEGEGRGVGLLPSLEPLAALRVGDSLAVEPVNLVVERRTAPGCDGDRGSGLRYGEWFRFRAELGPWYLCHEGGNLSWATTATGPSPLGSNACRDGKQARNGSVETQAPRGTRFTFHGGELGCPVFHGRRASLQRVRSPPPPEPESEYESDDSGPCDDLETDPRRPRLSGRLGHRPHEEPVQPVAPEVTLLSTIGGALPLFSRLADAEGGVAVSLLPVAPAA